MNEHRIASLSPDARQALLANLTARMTGRGEWEFPCLPAARDLYVQRLSRWFDEWGKPLRPDEVDQLRQLVGAALDEGFRANAGAKLLVKYELTVAPTLQKNLALQVVPSQPQLADEYTDWVGRDEQPLFGRHGDARALDVAQQLGDLAAARVLDVGAGDGRNAIPLAKLGCRIDAVELTPVLAERLQRAAAQQALPIEVKVGNLFDEQLGLETAAYDLILLSGVVSHFRSVDQLRQWLVRMADLVKPGGTALFNLFLADPGYEPDALVRELSQVAWASLFTPDELHRAMQGLRWSIVADDPVWEYERTHLPAEAWPPTPWFETWCLGRAVIPNLTERVPFEMHWIQLRESR